MSLDVAGGPCQGWHITTGSGPAGAGVQRNGLTVAVNKNPTDPKSWKQVLLLDKDQNNEDADPSLFQSVRDRKVHLYFTGRGKTPKSGGPSPSRLKYFVLDPDELVVAASGTPGPAAPKAPAKSAVPAPKTPVPPSGGGEEGDGD